MRSPNAALRRPRPPGTAASSSSPSPRRLPPEFRVSPADAVRLLQEEIFSRIAVHDLPPADRAPLLHAAAHDRIAGGRIYDAHIAEVARAAGANVVVTDNRRHFLSALRYGMRVETPSEFLAGLKKRPS